MSDFEFQLSHCTGCLPSPHPYSSSHHKPNIYVIFAIFQINISQFLKVLDLELIPKILFLTHTQLNMSVLTDNNIQTQYLLSDALTV